MVKPLVNKGDKSDKTLRVMADTNVLISSILSPRWFYEFLRHALKGDFQLVLSE
jgi:predicted nucleic acid-binding protein